MKPYANNPRRISDKQLSDLATWLAELGDLSGIVHDLNTDQVIGGNQRSKVFDINQCEIVLTDQRAEPDAQGTVALGYILWQGNKYAYRQVRWTEAQCRQANICANRAGGEWDFELLHSNFQVDDLLAWGFAPVELGLPTLTPNGADAEPQIDRAEELRQIWNVSSGQLWQLGEHRIICGDCTDAAVVDRVMGGERANGVFTSPPYAEQRKEQYGGIPADEYVDWWESIQENVRANLANDGSLFVNIKPHCEDGQRVLYVMDLVLAMVRRWNWLYVDELCWYSEGLPGYWPNRLRNSFEPIHHFSMMQAIKFYPKAVGHFSSSIRDGTGGLDRTNGGNYTINTPTKSGIAQPGNVLSIHSAANSNHAAAFPVVLPDFFIRAYSDPGDIWLDPFLGSGTTLMAAHQNKRRCMGIELLPKYVAVALQRFTDATGVQPVLIDEV